MGSPQIKTRQFLVGSLAAVVVFGFLCGGYAATTVTYPYAGVVRHSVTNATVNGRSVDYEVVVINTLDAGVSFFLTPDNGALPYETTRQTTKNFATAYSTEVAINAHFFDTSLSPETNNTGIAASNGTVYSPFETVGGLAALNISQDNFPETVTGVSGGTTFASSSAVPYTTIATGSMLIRDGSVVNTGATDLRARTQIGASRNGAEVMLFASSSGMTEQEGASILVNDFGAFHVHGLDGGGSTTMVLRTGASTQTIVAIENSFLQRAVGTNLGVQAGPYVAGIPDAMTWDASPGTAGIQQGAGTWDVSTSNWQSAGVNRTWANAKSPALGAGGGAQIALGNRIAVQNMTVGGGYTIGTAAGPTFTILGNLTVTGSETTTINAPLGSSSSFTKLGNQTLILGSSARISQLKTSEGTIDLSGNTLTILDPFDPLVPGGGAIQNGTLEITSGNATVSAPSGTTTISANLTISKMTKSGPGAVYLTAANTWTGPLVVSAGTLGFGPSATFPSVAATVSAGILDLAGASGNVTTLLMGGTAGQASAVSTGAGILNLGGTLTFNATNSPAGATISGRLGLGNTRTFAVNDSPAAADDLVVSADISGAFALTKTGSGTLVLSGNNSFTSFKNSGGTTRCGSTDALGTTTLTVESGIVDLNDFSETITGLTMGGVASATPELRTGAGILNLAGGLTYSATGNGTGSVIKGQVDLGPTVRTVTVGNSANADPDLRIEASVAGAITKAGAGRLELAGPLAMNGTFTVNNGEVLLSGGNRTMGAVTLGGTAGAYAVLDTGTTTLAVTGTLAFSNSNNGLGGILKGRVDLGGSLRTFTINNSTNATVDMRLECELTGAGGFAKGGAGTLELAGNNTLSGPMSVSAGVLTLSNSLALGNTASLTFSANATVDASGLPSSTLQVNAPSRTIGGVGTINGSVSLSAGKLSSSAGTLAISGGLSVSGGTIEVAAGTGPGTITVGGAASLGGTLKVTMAGTPLSGTQSKVLMTASSISGGFSSLQLPSPPAGTVYSISVTSTQVLLQVAPGTATQAWLGGMGLSLDSSMASDPDGDGNSLLAEYALGGQASVSDPALITPVPSAGALQISFQWNTAATDITCLVEASSNLSAWTTILSKTNGGAWTGNATFTQGAAVNNLAPVTVTDTSVSTPRYLRLRLVKP